MHKSVESPTGTAIKWAEGQARRPTRRGLGGWIGETVRAIDFGVDGLVVGVAFFATVAVFATGAGKLGFYSDDAGFLSTLGGKGADQTVRSALNYVPGRELHVIWQQLIFVVGGHSPSDLGTLHLIQSCLDGLAVALFYLLLRKLRIAAFWAVVGAATLAFYPNHGETHFWLSSAPMNVISTLLFIAFAYTTAVGFERTGISGQREPSWLLGLGFLFFGLALFTYDQTFFVLVFVLLLRAGQLIKRRVPVDLPLVGAGVGYVAVILIYAILKRHPQSGPTLTHFDVAHVWSNLQLSIATTFGWLFRYQLDFLRGTASAHDRAIGRIVAVGFVVICALTLARELLAASSNSPRRKPLVPSGVWRSVALGVVGVACFFLAYLPVYLWFISARHNFLPTAGLALAVAAAGSALTAALAKRAHRSVPIVFASAVTILLAVFVAQFVEAALSEKRYWQASYQLRRNLYSQLVQKRLLVRKYAIVFEGFPQGLGPAPYFGQENQFAVDYLYGNQVALKASSLSALQSRRGYYLYTEIDRFGPMPARYYPRAAVADIVYLSETDSSVRFATSSRAYALTRFYNVHSTRQEATTSTRRPAIRSAALSGHGRVANLTLDVSTGDLSLSPGQQLAAVLFHADGTPWTTPNPNGEPMVIPIGLTEARHPAAQLRYRIALRHLNQTVARPFARIGLYVLSRRLPQLLSSATLRS
jgi:hypothetical protein